ncbi:hypothetical protein BC938DRAFT_476110 [Jimgerdemannia flammicorona]|uniref:Uncharacterized protein n=1 Tax=Jimgerdemannia flammicorona TaxID=994334 RepID=A0A433QR01_9FUNG|nr:hypothetical protein BC938DRAFT_476110 [Jimgerdemannia flammicorona]
MRVTMAEIKMLTIRSQMERLMRIEWTFFSRIRLK